MILSRKAPAKINWFLSVLNKREDGYHNIISAMQCVDLFDTLSFEEDEGIHVCSDLDIPEEENLVHRTAVLLKRFSSCSTGARITLRKNIPVGAGLGGGSSDAAATLTGLNDLWRLGIDHETLRKLAAEIGSDVPFFLSGRPSLVEGRGENVTELEIGSSLDVLLVKPDISVSTSWAYRTFQAGLTKKSIDIKLFCQALDSENFAFLRDAVFNDLEGVVISHYPVIAEIKRMLERNGAACSLMSGSGSTVFGVFHSTDEAVYASQHLQGTWSRVVRTLNRSNESGRGNGQ